MASSPYYHHHHHTIPTIFVALLLLTTTIIEVKGMAGLDHADDDGGGLLDFGGMAGFPGLGPAAAVSLPPVNGSSLWGDILDDLLQHVLRRCQASRMCQAPSSSFSSSLAGLSSFAGARGCSQCHPCACDAACYARRDCCLDKQLRDARERRVLAGGGGGGSEPPPPPSYAAPPSSRRRTYGCHNTYLTPYDLAVHVWMVDTCPRAWKDDEGVRDRCENPSPNATFSHWPVWSGATAVGNSININSNSNSSNVVYRNADCARCNAGTVGEEPRDGGGQAAAAARRWNLQVACDRSVYLRKRNNDLVGAMRTALEEPTCQILFSPPRAARPFPCRPVTGRYVDVCNVTGLRRSYDATLWRACQTFNGQATVGGSTYRNVFCAMCNHERMPPSDPCHTDPPFPFFLEVNGSSFRDRSAAGAAGAAGAGDGGDGDDRPCRCADTEVYDRFEHQCRALQCGMTRQLQPGTKQCQSVVTNSSGVFYDLGLSLTPAADGGAGPGVQLRGTGPLTRAARNIRTAFLLQGSHTTGWHVMTHMFRVVAETEEVPGPERRPGDDSSSSGSKIQGLLRVIRFKVHIKFCSRWPEPSGALEDRLFAMMNSQWNFSVDGPTKHSFQAAPLYIAESQEEKANSFQRVSLLSSEGRVKRFVVDIPDSHIQSHGGELLETNYYLPISAALRCATVSFNLSREVELGEVSLVVNTTSGTVHHLPSDKFVSFQHVEVRRDGEVSVCADQIFDGHGPDMRREVPVSFVSPRLLAITIAFQAASVFLLGMVLVTFAVFAELRTTAGKTLLGVVSTLILTIAMTGGSVFGVGTVAGCQVLGVLSHFFLQSALTWAVIGSFHAYLLVSGTSSRSWQARCLNDTRLFRRYVLFALLIPAALVGLILLCELPEMRDSCVTDFGYGNGLCFVSSHNGLSAAASVPLIVILITIATCCWALGQLRRLTANRSESFRQHFYHFTVQAVVTGLVGPATFLHMLALLKDMGVLWYLSVCLHVALVVHIFIAFFCKPRVLKLWSALLVASVCVKRLPSGPKFSPVDT